MKNSTGRVVKVIGEMQEISRYYSRFDSLEVNSRTN